MIVVGIKLITLNIEGGKHLDRVLAFLGEGRAEVVCLQEICAGDVPAIEALGYRSLYAPMILQGTGKEQKSEGIAVFYTSAATNITEECLYYVGEGIPTLPYDATSLETRRQTGRRLVALVTLSIGGVPYRIGTTHFTWNSSGEADAHQIEDVRNMLDIVKENGELVLCGDFNAPRGGPIFATIASELRDNIPLSYRSSLDPVLHRKPHLQLMVDGIFSTPKYRVSEVEMTFGISDHAAVRCRITTDEM